MQRPPWTIDGDASGLVLTAWGDERPAEGVRLDAREAEWLLGRILGLGGWRGAAGRALTEAARYVAARHAVRLGVRADEPRQVVTAALARGLLVGWRVEARHQATEGGDGAGEDAELLAAGELRRKTWIEIELTDMDGNPVPGERYRIKLPDGTVREGALDTNGRAYFGELDPGSAEIVWPDRDGEATLAPPAEGQRALAGEARGAATGSRAGAAERTWVEIELLDMAGSPVPHERYWVKLPDGAVREGVLDAQGLAYFDDLDPGQCTIRWLGRDEEAAFLEPDATAPGPTDLVAAQVQTLISAARDGSAFCEECERARRAEGEAA